MWKIEITPSKVQGDGEIRIADTPPDSQSFGFVVEDYRRVSFNAESREELIKGIVSYGLVTGKITPDDIRDYLATPTPPGSEVWGLEQWEAYEATLDAAIEEVRANPERFRVGPDGKTPYEREQANKTS